MSLQDSVATFIGLSNDNEFFSAHYLAEGIPWRPG